MAPSIVPDRPGGPIEVGRGSAGVASRRPTKRHELGPAVEVREQLADGPPGRRVDRVRGDLGERGQDEPADGHARVREPQAGVSRTWSP